jgi:transposase
MPKNFVACDRDQQMLLPTDMREWLPANHLVWLVIDSVEQLDLSAFYDWTPEERGRPAFAPKMMVTLLLYAYAMGIRSAREIERRIQDDVALRVIAAGATPDHSTICRFRTRYREPLSGLFVSVVGLCARAGLVRPQVVAIDGTKVAANASQSKNLTRDQLEDYARRVFDEAERIDQQENELYGERRGDELPEHLRKRPERIEWLRRELAAQEEADVKAHQRRMKERADKQAAGFAILGTEPQPPKKKTRRINWTDPDSRVQKTSGDYLQGYNAQAAVTGDQVIVAADLVADTNDYHQLEPMITQAKDNLDAAGAAQPIGTVVADAGYFSDDNAILEAGPELLIAPTSTKNLAKTIANRRPPPAVDREAELRRWRAEVALAELYARQREAVIDGYLAGQVTLREVTESLGVSVAYAYWLATTKRNHGWIPGARPPKPPPSPSGADILLERFARPGALDTYRMRAQTVEPVFGQLKEQRRMRRLLHRGLDACRCEWRMMATAHNLRKLLSSRARRLISLMSFAPAA